MRIVLILGVISLLALAGRITPIKNALISLSTSNPQLESTYTFHLTLPSGLPISSSVMIQYPPESYSPGLATSPSAFRVYTPTTNLTSVTILSGRLFTISPTFSLSANSHLNITIDSLLNPSKRGGTGNFKIYTVDQKGHLVDEAQSFGVVGFTEVALGLIDLTVVVDGDKAGQTVGVKIGFTNLENMFDNTKITIDFPLGYGLSNTKSCVCQEQSMTWELDQTKNSISIINFPSLSKGVYINCSLTGITNPQYEQITDLFYVTVGIMNSFSVTQQGYINPLYIKANAITVITSSNTSLFNNFARTITLDLYPHNPFKAIKIVSPFEPVTSVLLENGISAESLNVTLLYNVIQLTNMLYTDGTIKISLTGVLLSQNNNSITNLIEIYTYLDPMFQFLVDYSNSSNTTQLSLQGNITNISTITVTSSSLEAQSNNTLTFTVNTPSDCIISEVVLEIPQQYTSLINCTVNGALVDPCELINETVIMFLSPSLASPIQIVLNIVNPRIATNVPISIVVYSNISTFYQSLPITITPTSFQNLLIQPIYGVGLKVTANTANLRVINGNTLKQTSYTHHSYFELTYSTEISAYACDFVVFIPDLATQLSNAKCLTNGSKIVIYGYDDPVNKTIISFVILSQLIISQAYTLTLYQVFKNMSSIYAISTFSLPAFTNSPAIVSHMITNQSYLGTVTIHTDVTISEYYLLNFPSNTACCSNISLDLVPISKLTYLNTSNGVAIRNISSLTSQSIHIYGLNLNAGFTNGTNVKITEIKDGSAITQKLFSIQFHTFVENWELILPYNTANFPYSNYTFKFATNFAQLIQTQLTLNFHSSYSFIAYPPTLQQMLINGQKIKSLPTVSVISNSSLKITSLPQSLYGNVSFTLFGIVNPAAGSYLISVVYSDITGYQYAASSISYSITAAAPSHNKAPELNLIPNTTSSSIAQVLDISLPFTFLPKDMTIQIQFSGFVMSASTLIESDGYLDYTITPPNILSAVVMNHINKSDLTDISIQIYNFSAVSSSLAANVGMSYHMESIYQQTTTVSVSPPSTPATCLASVSFYPMNSAEVATYDFTIPQLQVMQGMKIGIIFGSQFERLLTKRDLDIRSDQLSGPIDYEIYHHMLLILGFTSQPQPIDTVISIFGITNPNRNSLLPTTDFSVIILEASNTIVQFGTMNGVVLSLPPKVLQLNSVSISQPLSRYVSTYTFSISVDSMPSEANGGMFVVDFPEEYWIDSIGECSTDHSFSLSAYCALRGYRLTVKTYQSEIFNATQVTLQVNGIKNPEFEGQTSNFIVYVYDNNNKIVHSRTYGNVNPSFITSNYAAEDIIVNNMDPIVIEKGFLSDAFFIHFQQPAKVPIALVPNVLSQELIVIPSFIQVQIGDVDIEFRLATSTAISETKLQLNWTKTNDKIDNMYMPLYRSPILIQDAKSTKTLLVDIPSQLYQNGSSFPQSVCVQNPPYNSLSVFITLNNTCTISPTTIPQITILSSCTSYSIACPLSTNPGSVSLTISNSQQSIYQLAQSVHIVTLRPYDSAIPAVNDLSISQVSRTKVQIQVDSPDLMNMHYVVADCGYQQVDFSDVYSRNSSDVLAWSRAMFGVVNIKSIGITYYYITGLEADHCYQFTFYLVSMFSVQNNTPIVLTTITNIAEQGVEFTLRLRQAELLTAFEVQYLNSIATILAIDSSRLVSDSCNRTFFDDSGVLYWNVILLPNLTNSNTNIEPTVMINYLSSALNTLKGFIPKLITQSLAWSYYSPVNWPASALYLSTIKSTSVSFKFLLPTCLNLSLVITEDPTILSTPFQITRLLTSINIPASLVVLSSVVGNLSSQLTFNNLKNDVSYTLQAIATNFVINRTELPTVIQFSTIRQKEIIDINSIFKAGNKLLITTASLIILAV